MNNLENNLSNDLVNSLLHTEGEERAKEVASLVNWFVFSDTIIVYSHFEDGEQWQDRSNRWTMMNYVCMLLWRRIFSYGLPIRGLIHCGEFAVDQRSFVGQAIVEAYDLSNKMNLSVTAYTSQAQKQLHEDKKSEEVNNKERLLLPSWMPAQLFEYSVPMKNLSASRMLVQNPLAMTLEDQAEFLGFDLRDYVHSMMSLHNKDITEPVYPKFSNTELYLRTCKSRIKAMFDRDKSR
ncbi:MAG: hypothetical protein AAFX76_13015 [Planctomycetota bacterium]